LKLETGKTRESGIKAIYVCGETSRKSRIMDFNPKGGKE
jgi:hypothetical protein